jgi:hypothetical protein
VHTSECKKPHNETEDKISKLMYKNCTLQITKIYQAVKDPVTEIQTTM